MDSDCLPDRGESEGLGLRSLFFEGDSADNLLVAWGVAAAAPETSEEVAREATELLDDFRRPVL